MFLIRFLLLFSLFIGFYFIDVPLVEAKELSKSQAVSKVMKRYPGKLIYAKVSNKKQGKQYKIRIIMKTGKVKNIRVDAKSGRIL